MCEKAGVHYVELLDSAGLFNMKMVNLCIAVFIHLRVSHLFFKRQKF